MIKWEHGLKREEQWINYDENVRIIVCRSYQNKLMASIDSECACFIFVYQMLVGKLLVFEYAAVSMFWQKKFKEFWTKRC